MIFSKALILFTLLFLAFIQPVKVDSSTNNSKSQNSSIQPDNIDSLSNVINTSGWNNDKLSEFARFIINTKSDLKNEPLRIKSLQQGYQTSFLQALILKKSYNFKSMYDSLASKLYLFPAYPEYYEELSFAANAAGMNSALENTINTLTNFPETYKNYLNALIASNRSNYGKSLELLKKVETDLKDNKEFSYRLSYAYRNAGDYQKALDVLMYAINIYRDDNWFLARSFLAEGSLYFLSNDYSKAESYYKKGFELSKKIGDTKDLAKAYINLAIMEDVKGNLDAARDNYKKAIKLAGEIKDIESLAAAHSELGVSYTYTKKLIESKKHYLKSFNLYKKMNNKLRLSLLSNNLGKIYMFMFNYKTAIDYFEKGLETAGDNKRSQALNLMGLGDAYSNLSNYAKALKYYRQARRTSAEINDISLNAEVNSGLGILNFNLDNYKRALNFFQSSDTLSSKAQNPYLTADAFHKLGVTYFQFDSLKKADSYLQQAISIIEKNNRCLYRGSFKSRSGFTLYLSKRNKKSRKITKYK